MDNSRENLDSLHRKLNQCINESYDLLHQHITDHLSDSIEETDNGFSFSICLKEDDKYKEYSFNVKQGGEFDYSTITQSNRLRTNFIEDRANALHIMAQILINIQEYQKTFPIFSIKINYPSDALWKVGERIKDESGKVVASKLEQITFVVDKDMLFRLNEIGKIQDDIADASLAKANYQKAVESLKQSMYDNKQLLATIPDDSSAAARKFDKEEDRMWKKIDNLTKDMNLWEQVMSSTDIERVEALLSKQKLPVQPGRTKIENKGGANLSLKVTSHATGDRGH